MSGYTIVIAGLVVIGYIQLAWKVAGLEIKQREILFRISELESKRGGL
jgi:hypothetical protein